MSIKNRPKIVPLLLAGAMLVTAVTPLILSQVSHAASLSEVAVRFDRMVTGSQTTGTVCAKPYTVATEASVNVVFPTGYTLGAAGTFTVDTTTNTTSWPTNGVAWPGIATATNVTSQTVTFPSNDLTVNSNVYCFNWVNSAAVKVPSSANSSLIGSVTTRTSVPADIDTESYATAAVDADQIQVSATVPSLFSFALANTTDALGTLGTGIVKTSATPATATVNTNAKNGWMVWAKDSNVGLKSTSNPSAIIATNPGVNSTLSAGTAGYNTGATFAQTGGSATPTIDAVFNGSTAYRGGGLDTTLRTLASSTGTAKDAVITLKNNVAIDATTAAAADYTDTITVVGAGLF